MRMTLRAGAVVEIRMMMLLRMILGKLHQGFTGRKGVREK